MTPNEHMSSIRADADRMVAAAAGSLESSVPACPAWNVADLVSHLGWLHRTMRYLVTLPEGETYTPQGAAAAGLPKFQSTQHPQTDLLPWFEEGVDLLLQAFEETPPTKPLTTLFGQHPASLLVRRMAHETAIHRWDAVAATGTPSGFDAAHAVDGVDEQLGVFVPMVFKHADFGGSGQTIHLHSTDTGDGWLITVHADSTDWRRAHDENADVTARANASDLYLLVWNRIPAHQFDVAGDRDVLTRWQAAAAF